MSNSTHLLNLNDVGGYTAGQISVVNTTGVSSAVISTDSVQWYAQQDNLLLRDYAKVKQVKINAGLYFRYVKKKFTTIQKKELDNRLKKLVHLQLQAELTDQKGLLEEVEGLMLVAAREQVLVVKKIDRFVPKDVVDKFLAKTENVYLKPLEQFPRPIPTDVQKKIKQARELKVFDDFVVVYTDYTKEPIKKSNADKVREKDPIIFGQMKGSPNRLYYIADWVDEFCDLTLDKLIERCKPEDDSELVRRVEDLKSGTMVNELTKRVQDRIDRLNGTTRENWRQREREAALEKSITETPKPLIPEPKKAWWKFWQ